MKIGTLFRAYSAKMQFYKIEIFYIDELICTNVCNAKKLRILILHVKKNN